MSYVEERTCSWFVNSISETNAGMKAALLHNERALAARPCTSGGF